MHDSAREVIRLITRQAMMKLIAPFPTSGKSVEDDIALIKSTEGVKQ